jgi:hypothetical protein
VLNRLVLSIVVLPSEFINLFLQGIQDVQVKACVDQFHNNLGLYTNIGSYAFTCITEPLICFVPLSIQVRFSGDKPYRVLKVVDGDTIKIEYKGRSGDLFMTRFLFLKHVLNLD